ncbi:hypothetical protein BJ878DRAFT_482859 [Calycina marina]|uniref:Proteophosphoglycan ppg4 n=1 Tax=Calycina marina TaxID=1763456 RepID=A0A9P7YWX3_9HELO|nr:hypothetical protein BJ878DRAFT_482859 [Calycina marina]
MGNEQSTPATRRQNRLSKPRTNTTTVPTTRPTVQLNRRDSVLQQDGVGNRYSVISNVAVVSQAEPDIEDENVVHEKKRMSLFRSKSSQARASLQQLSIGSGVGIEHLNETPIRKPGIRVPERLSKGNSLVDQSENSYTSPASIVSGNNLTGTDGAVVEMDDHNSSAFKKGQWSRSNSLAEDPALKYEFTPPIPRVPIMRTLEQRAQVETQTQGLPFPRHARMSLQHVPYSQHQTRLSLVPEGPSRQSSNRRSVTTETLHQLQSRDISYASRTSSDTQLYGPTRRRSMLQHGVATRTSWVDSDPRSTLPSQTSSPSMQLPAYKHNLAWPNTLPERSNTEPPRSSDQSVRPRVSTPDVLDYGHIGAFKLGSLRITNGAASPDLIVDKANPASTVEDYISAGQADNRPPSGPNSGHRSQTISVPQKVFKSPWTTRTESPLQKTETVVSNQTPLLINTDAAPSSLIVTFVDSPTRAQDLAKEYQELTMSPFSYDHSPTPPKLESRSKNMATEDDLFAPEPASLEVSSYPKRGSTDSAIAPDDAIETKQDTQTEKELPWLPRKPLAKADSGYSSNVSIRSFKKNPAVSVKEASPIPPKPVSRTASSTYSVSSQASAESDRTVIAKPSLPAPPKEDMLQRFGVPPPVPQTKLLQNLSSRTATTKPEAQLLLKSQKRHTRSKSIPNLTNPGFEVKDSHYNSSGSAVSTASTSRWRRTSRSKITAPPQPVFTVQASPSHEEQMDIPIPSIEASKHLEKRVGSFPTASMPNTAPVMRRSVSKETLKTMFSVGSAEYREELARGRLQSALPAVPTPIEEEPKSGFSRRHTYQFQQPARTPVLRKSVQNQSFSLSVTRTHQEDLQEPLRQETLRQETLRQDFETEITSFESVSTSLGKPPYDAALSSDEAKVSQRWATSMTAQLEADAAACFKQAFRAESPARPLYKQTSIDDIVRDSGLPARPTSAISSPSRRLLSAHGNGHIRKLSQRSISNVVEPHSPPSTAQLPLHLERSQRSISNLRNAAASQPEPPCVPQLKISQELLSNIGDGKSAFVANLGRMKFPPPVSMKTQGKTITPAKTKLRTPTPKATAGTLPSLVSELALPPPPPTSATRPNKAVEESSPWAEQQNYWAQRKQEALRTRKSMELQRPERARQSFESQHGIQLKRPESSRPSMDYQRRSQYNSWNNYGQDGYGSLEYDHTYGSYTSSSEQRNVQYDYDGGAGDQYHERSPVADKNLARSIHGRSTSTSDMFALDGFGLDFEPGIPQTTSVASGVRKMSGLQNADFGVDFSDVPVLRIVQS